MNELGDFVFPVRVDPVLSPISIKCLQGTYAMTYKKRSPIVAFWLNDRPVPFSQHRVSLAEIAGTVAVSPLAVAALIVWWLCTR